MRGWQPDGSEMSENGWMAGQKWMMDGRRKSGRMDGWPKMDDGWPKMGGWMAETWLKAMIGFYIFMHFPPLSFVCRPWETLHFNKNHFQRFQPNSLHLCVRMETRPDTDAWRGPEHLETTSFY